jgi:ABC-type branched-subunit amino acid transport system ATPase component
MESDGPLPRLENVSRDFCGTMALADVNFFISRGEISGKI